MHLAVSACVIQSFIHGLYACRSASLPVVGMLLCWSICLSIYPSTNLLMHLQHPPDKATGAHHGAPVPASSFADAPAIQLNPHASPAQCCCTRCSCPGEVSPAMPWDLAEEDASWHGIETVFSAWRISALAAHQPPSPLKCLLPIVLDGLMQLKLPSKFSPIHTASA